MKASSGDYRKDNALRIITDDTNDKFESRTITGATTGATAIVDRVENLDFIQLKSKYEIS